jgi:hypothetical protein
MSRRALLLVLVLLVLLAPGTSSSASAQSRTQARTLWPGVTYELVTRQTARGPVAVHVLTGPRPGGLTTLEPLLSNDSLLGLETVTSMQKRRAVAATTAGVSGDFFSFQTGLPSGGLIRDTQLVFPPYGDRSTAGILADGTLDVRRVAFFATWQGTGVKRTLNDLNRPVRENGVGLFTDAYSTATPAYADAASVVLFPLPAAVPGIDLAAPVAGVAGAGSVPIPPGGAVLVARGSSAAALAAEAAVGATVVVNFALRSGWAAAVSAIGGGPQLVRDGKPIFNANEAFRSSQLLPRAPRAAVGQLRDGRIVLVAVDGRQPGYSIGLTTFELALELARLGAVTAMALDGGGSVTMAAEGQLLNRPSDGRERPVANALVFSYGGVYVPLPVPVVSPNGDGVDDEQRLAYKLVRSARVSVTLTRPDGGVAFAETAERQPGVVEVPFPAAPGVPPSGRWTLAVRAVDDLGRETAMSRSFTVDTTLGFLRVRKLLFLPPAGREHVIAWRQGRAARVRVTIEDASGTVVRTLALRRYRSGPRQVVWNGLDRSRARVAGGRYAVRVVARSALGTTELSTTVRVRRVGRP